MWPRPYVCLALLSLTYAASAWGEEQNFNPRQNVWAVGLQSRPLYFTGNSGQKLRMTSSTIDISRVWVKEKWWANVDVSLVVGPFSRRQPLSPPLDFSGSGFSARIAYPLFSDGLRQPSGDWGLTLGLENMDLVGRSYRRENLVSGSYTEGWSVRARWTAVLPGLFYSILKPARPKGNRPEWLVTRIEGYTFVLAGSFPIQGQYKQSFSLNGDSIKTSSDLQGYAIQMAFSAWLGI